ncbi:MAG: endonuclease III [Ignavibacteriae bacterium]|nr:endonuclease III [Ignavibacteriota bacterium]
MNKEQLKKKVKEIIKYLSTEYPEAKTHLEYKTPFELLISTVLAAQCTDIRVNKDMVPLYQKKYKTPRDILDDGTDNFRDNIKSITFPNNKAKAVIAMCEQLVKDFNGKVPNTMEELTKLAGVGNFKRVTERLGLTENKDPEKIEMELKELVLSDEQFNFSLRIGEHGRQICDAKKPKCDICFLNHLCPSKNLFNKPNKK